MDNCAMEDAVAGLRHLSEAAEQLSSAETCNIARKSLCILINGFLTDRCTEHKKSHAAEYDSVLEFIVHYIQVAPRVFLHRPAVTGPDETQSLSQTNLSDQLENDRAFYKALMSWLVSRLLQILSCNLCAESHVKIHNVLATYLKQAYQKDPVVYAWVLNQILEMFLFLSNAGTGDASLEKLHVPYLQIPQHSFGSSPSRSEVLKFMVATEKLLVLCDVAQVRQLWSQLADIFNALIGSSMFVDSTLHRLWVVSMRLPICDDHYLHLSLLRLLRTLLGACGHTIGDQFWITLEGFAASLSKLFTQHFSVSDDVLQSLQEFLILLSEYCEEMPLDEPLNTACIVRATKVLFTLTELLLSLTSKSKNIAPSCVSLVSALLRIVAYPNYGNGFIVQVLHVSMGFIAKMFLDWKCHHFCLSHLVPLILSHQLWLYLMTESSEDTKLVRIHNISPVYKLLCEEFSRSANKLDDSKDPVSLDDALTFLEFFSSTAVTSFLSLMGTALNTWSNWLSNDDMVRLVAGIEKFLVAAEFGADSAQFASSFLKVSQTVSQFIRLTEEKLPACFYELSVFCFSLPWLPQELSWLDYSPTNSKQLAHLANTLTSKCVPVRAALNNISFQSLSTLPKDIAPNWRKHIFQLALGGHCVERKKAAINGCPVLLHFLGPNSNHLMHEMPISDTSVALELASNFGILACTVARQTTFKASHANGIQCEYCDLVNEEATQPATKPKSANLAMFAPFFHLCGHEDHVVKLNALTSVHRVLNHISLKGKIVEVQQLLDACSSALTGADDELQHLCCSLLAIISTVEDTFMEEMTLGVVKKLLAANEAHANQQTMQAALKSLKSIAKLANGELFNTSMMLLYRQYLIADPFSSATAYMTIREIVTAGKTTMQDFFCGFQADICKILAEAICDPRRHNTRHDASSSLLSNTALLFEFSSKESLAQKASRYLVPVFVGHCNSSAIRMVASALKTTKKKLLISTLMYTYPYLVCYTESKVQQAGLRYLSQVLGESGLNLGDLLKLNCHYLRFELLRHLHDKYHEVFSGLAEVAAHDEHYKGPPITSEGEMAIFLKPRLLGILTLYDNLLLSSNTSVSEVKGAMDSITAILQLMGSTHITPVTMKILTTLKIGLKFQSKRVLESCCAAWNAYIHLLSPITIGPICCQVVATLLPFLVRLRRSVSDIINYIVIERENDTKNCLSQLHFLPDVPELSPAKNVLARYIPNIENDSLTCLVGSTLKGLQHDCHEVKVEALERLLLILKTRQNTIWNMMSGSSSFGVLLSVVTALLQNCKSNDMAVSTLCVQCVGAIGACDPARFGLHMPRRDEVTFSVSVFDDDFSCKLINLVSRSYLSASDTRTQDACAFALQELLAIYGITEPKPGASNILWESFDAQVQEILRPHLSSHYILEHKADWSSLPQPIFGSRKGGTFKEWVCNWSGYLASKVSAEYGRRVFESCVAMLKTYDTQVGLFLLPYAMVCALLSGDQEVHEVLLREILTILGSFDRESKQQSNDTVTAFKHIAAQTVFSVLDHLSKWQKFRLSKTRQKKAHLISGTSDAYVSENQQELALVKTFSSKIPLDILAMASFGCQTYARSLQVFEQHLAVKECMSEEDLDLMQKMYVSLGEPDGVAGVAKLRRSTSSLKEQILVYQVTGNMSDALACYEKAISSDKDDLRLWQEFLQCLLDVGRPSSSLVQFSGILSEHPAWTGALNSYRIEAAWQLGKWDDVNRFLADEPTKSATWSVDVARLLLSIESGDNLRFLDKLRVAQQNQVGPLSAASLESDSYLRGYNCISRLHMLFDCEMFVKILFDIGADTTTNSDDREARISKVTDFWAHRFSLLQPSFRTQWENLNFQRALLLTAKAAGFPADTAVGRLWLKTAKVARKAGQLQVAQNAILHAEQYGLPEYCLENAKWLFCRSEVDKAQMYLEKNIIERFGPLDFVKIDALSPEEANLFAKELLLMTKYQSTTASVKSNMIIKHYQKVLVASPSWDEAHFLLAVHYEKLLSGQTQSRDHLETQPNLVFNIAMHYGQALQFGYQHVYRAMPAMLSLWLDFASHTVTAVEKQRALAGARARVDTPQTQTLNSHLIRLNECIRELTKKIAPYKFFTSFSQLVSRICHPHPDVASLLQNLIATLLTEFPQQAFWKLIAVTKSTYPVRAKRCQEILKLARNIKPSIQSFLSDTTKLADEFLNVCNHQVGPNVATLSMATHFRKLHRLVEDQNFSQIIVPIQATMTVSLPSTDNSSSSHSPFGDNPVYIRGFLDTVDVIRSLAKPKKIVILGSDGNQYPMMCKPKDDLRKDNRLLEFNEMVNTLLRHDPEASKRFLYIRTFCVVPLNEECGLIEWVPNVQPFRHILIKIYKERGICMTGAQLQQLKVNKDDELELKMSVYKTKLLPRHPAVFGEWFLRTFPDPTRWYQARLAYIRTTAVMSIVGYILGLGDRHGENILLDSETGDTVHVDFNCLFNKGESFDYPELVPFRLTHNMVSAMGPMGFEGFFRRACEITMKVVREQSDTLAINLKTFLHDPLVEWGKSQSKAASGEVVNEKAQVSITAITHRLKGIIQKSHNKKIKDLPLSVEGHVNWLIKTATDEVNLCKMYIGWAAYM